MVDRPAELPDESPVDAADVWQGAPAFTTRPQATHVPPPVAKPVATATVDPMLEAEF